MTGNKAVLDSNVLIFLSKRRIDVNQLLTLYDEFYVSIVTYMEIYGYTFENANEKQLIDNFFELVEVIDIDINIAKEVIEYRKNSTKKIKLPDAIILSTAKLVGADLLTDDWDDFRGFDIAVRVCDIDALKVT